MSSKRRLTDDELVLRYLLSELPEEEVERLDELSIVDDEFAWELTAAENDLIDGYLRGELSEERRQSFQSLYLSAPGISTSASRLQKVDFAAALLRREQRGHAAEKPARPVHPLFGNRWMQFGAVAAFLVLLTGTYFLHRKPPVQSQTAQTAKVEATPEPNVEPRTGKAVSPPVHTVSPAVFLLMPATRAPGRLSTIVLSHGVEQAVFRLRLEFDEFPRYRATLTDLALNKVSWRSDLVRAQPHGKDKDVSVVLPATPLRSGNYSFELSGVPKTQSAESIGSYPFKLVIR